MRRRVRRALRDTEPPNLGYWIRTLEERVLPNFEANEEWEQEGGESCHPNAEGKAAQYVRNAIGRLQSIKEHLEVKP